MSSCSNDGVVELNNKTRKRKHKKSRAEKGQTNQACDGKDSSEPTPEVFRLTYTFSNKMRVDIDKLLFVLRQDRFICDVDAPHTMIWFAHVLTGVRVSVSSWHISYTHTSDLHFKQAHSEYLPSLLSMLAMCGVPQTVEVKEWYCSANCYSKHVPQLSLKDSAMAVWLRSHCNWDLLKDKLVPHFASLRLDNEDGACITWHRPHCSYKNHAALRDVCSLSTNVELAVLFRDGKVLLKGFDDGVSLNPIIEKAKMLALLKRIVLITEIPPEPELVVEHDILETKLFELFRYYSTCNYDVTFRCGELVVNRTILGERLTVVIGGKGRFLYQVAERNLTLRGAVCRTYSSIFRGEVASANRGLFDMELVYQGITMCMHEQAIASSQENIAIKDALSKAQEKIKADAVSLEHAQAELRSKKEEVAVLEAKLLRVSNEAMASQPNACTMCYTNERRVVLPCGHFATCVECTEKLERKECPYCKKPFTDYTVIYPV